METDYRECSIGYALGDSFNTASIAVLNLANLLQWLRCRAVEQKYHCKTTIGKIHRGYTKSRLRIHQRRG